MDYSVTFKLQSFCLFAIKARRSGLFIMFALILETRRLQRNYAMESIYAYRQLIRNTNFPAYGRVAFFLDEKAKDVLTPIYESVGLLSLVRWVDVGEYQNFTGYFKYFSDEYFEDCRYVFESDADMWFFRFNLNQPLFDWGAFIQELDTADEMTIYALRQNKGKRRRITSTDMTVCLRRLCALHSESCLMSRYIQKNAGCLMMRVGLLGYLWQSAIIRRL